jgi:predicted transcriptional regulator
MKKYQVFVSSTYQDLREERKEVIQALLELDCIPVGMELFPATDDDQWTLIKELIDESDYYILIIGGRYGSLNKAGISYTQMEYEYAIEIGVPVISFLIKEPDDVAVSKTDKDSEKQELLGSFRKLASKKMIKHWQTPEELGSVVSRSLVKLIKTKPRTGWVKADKISTDEANLEILKLKDQIQALEDELDSAKGISIDSLAQGDDEHEISLSYQKTNYGDSHKEKVTTKWNDLFAKTATILIDEASEPDYRKQVNAYLKHLMTQDLPRKPYNVTIIIDAFKSIIIQFKALGLIEQSVRKRSLKDTETYWKLTTKGDSLLTNLRAIRKETSEQ